MASPIEDYALLSDLQTAGLVSREGSVDWLCFPRFDSEACFAALLGTPENGRWLLRPAIPVVKSRRRYRPDTLILETDYETESGAVRVTDFMPVRGNYPDIVRIVDGIDGRVTMTNELVMRLGYGSVVPWIHASGDGLLATAGPHSLRLECDRALERHADRTASRFSVEKGQRAKMVLTWFPSHEKPPAKVPADRALEDTERYWRHWCGRCTYRGPYRDAVTTSLMVLKALTYKPTGGIVAAPTTSLPEMLGGVRNWDYRFCWVRDATFTLYSLLLAGYKQEAHEWREWLLRAVAGTPAQMQIMYSVLGERRLSEYTADWLGGYEGSLPVRIGNAAHTQFQLDVYGELMDTFHFARETGLSSEAPEWRIQAALLEFLEGVWKEPDQGIWEVRGPRRHFTHSKVMAWVALDRGVSAVERCGLPGPLERWKRCRDAIHDEVCREGFSRETGTFVQYYGSRDLDASLLMMPLVGFLPASDPRMRATIEAIERDLMRDGLVLRYPTRASVDGLPPGEGVFLPCTFWLADNLMLLERRRDARELFERLLSLRNDLGLLSEEYDPATSRLVGNFPQAFSHVALVNTAFNLTEEVCPLTHRTARAA